MTLIKLDDAIRVVRSVQTRFDHGTIRHPVPVLGDAIEALRALPTVSVTDQPWITVTDGDEYAKLIAANMANASHVIEVVNHSIDFDGNETFTKKSIAALPVSDGWEDIATAPVGQVPLMLWARRAGDPTFQVVCGCRYGRQWAIYGTARSQVCLDIVDPLFWRPLPAPPTIERHEMAGLLQESLVKLKDVGYYTLDIRRTYGVYNTYVHEIAKHRTVFQAVPR